MPRVHFVVSRSGEAITPGRASTRIDACTTLEWYIPYVAEALNWPAHKIRLCYGDVVVEYKHRINDRTHTRCMELLALGLSSEDLVVNVVKLPLGSFAEEGDCACDLGRGSCCLLCRVAGPQPCDGCGNTGCCRSGSCGHSCCESPGSTGNYVNLCSYDGCGHYWAHYVRDESFNEDVEDVEDVQLPAGFSVGAVGVGVGVVMNRAVNL